MLGAKLIGVGPVLRAPVTAADVGHDEGVGGQGEPAQARVTHSLVHQAGRRNVGESLNLLTV